jgi:DNA-binding transcriptional LysR family regulator
MTTFIQQACRDIGGFEPRLDYPTDDVAIAQPLVAAGLAVALLPALNLVPPHAGVTVRPLPEAPLAREIWCLQPANRRLPAAAAMIEAMSAAAQNL